jgi:hypothetical protein
LRRTHLKTSSRAMVILRTLPEVTHRPELRVQHNVHHDAPEANRLGYGRPANRPQLTIYGPTSQTLPVVGYNIPEDSRLGYGYTVISDPMIDRILRIQTHAEVPQIGIICQQMDSTWPYYIMPESTTFRALRPQTTSPGGRGLE